MWNFRQAAFWQLAGPLCLFGLVARLLAFGLNPGPLNPDEDFQYLEQAHRLVFGTGLVPWEYVAGIRSWLLPLALTPIFAAARHLSEDPQFALWGVAVLLSMASLPTIVCGAAWGARAAGSAGAVSAGVLNAAWFELVYFSPHALADSVGTSLLIPGLFLAGAGGEAAVSATRARRVVWSPAFWGGALLGLALAVRLQLAPVVALALLLAGRCGKQRGALLGLASALLLAGALDTVTLGTPFQSLWYYAWVNLAHGAATRFGTEPWYWYFEFKLVAWSVAAGPLILAIGLGSWRRPVLLALAAAILAPLMLLAHKEDRFLLPALPLLLTLAGIGGAVVADRFKAGARRFVRMGCGVVWLAVCAVAAADASAWHRLYDRPEIEAALRAVNGDPAACGVAIYPAEAWARLPASARLRPDIPIYGLQPGDRTGAAAFDYIFDGSGIGGDDGLAALGFDRVQCWRPMSDQAAANLFRHVCLWHRAARCDRGAARPFSAPVDPDDENW